MAEAVYKRIAMNPLDATVEAGAGPQAETSTKGVNRNLVFVALVVALVFIGCSLFLVWSHHQGISLGYQTSQASLEEQKLLQENKRLRLELAALKSPSRIERLAVKELGLVKPQKEQFIIVR
jgi:cell division protein FtsL